MHRLARIRDCDQGARSVVVHISAVVRGPSARPGITFIPGYNAGCQVLDDLS